MQTTKLSQSERVAFVAALKRSGEDRADNAVCDLTEMYLDTTDYTTALRDIPKVVPEVVRRQLVKLAKDASQAARDFNAVLDSLTEIGENYLEDLEDARQKALPRCKCCSQVLPAKSKR